MLVVSGFYVSSPAVRILKTAVSILIMGVLTCKYTSILGNPSVTHSVPTAFVMNAVGTEWVTPGLTRMVYEGCSFNCVTEVLQGAL